MAKEEDESCSSEDPESSSWAPAETHLSRLSQQGCEVAEVVSKVQFELSKVAEGYC